MAVARERGVVSLPPERAMAMWVDPRRWTMWVDGFQRLVELPETWPEPGTKIVWVSVPHGRGRVTEKSQAHQPPRLFVVDVFEERLIGRQTVHFEPADDGGTLVSIELEYALTKGGVFQALANVIFIRPRLREAYRRTLRRFAVEAAEEAALPSAPPAPPAS